MRKETRNRFGFTLIEVIIGVMVIMTVVAMAMAALNRGFAMAQFSRDSTQVSQILQSEMEIMRLKNWPQMENLVRYPDWEERDATQHIPSDTSERFQTKRTLEEIEDGLLLARVVVEWKPARGPISQREYFSYITRNGINDFYYGALPSTSRSQELQELYPDPEF
ncbi:MAG: prepilin-type N-terminal cleavage/methylation domain-containing protein [Opitutales bacterium]|nr:prepilin-type N-terminal cleavage/methylation domain-containing protein [Opitutales bacterium]